MLAISGCAIITFALLLIIHPLFSPYLKWLNPLLTPYLTHYLPFIYLPFNPLFNTIFTLYLSILSVSVYYVAVRTIVLSRHGSNLATFIPYLLLSLFTAPSTLIYPLFTPIFTFYLPLCSPFIHPSFHPIITLSFTPYSPLFSPLTLTL